MYLYALTAGTPVYFKNCMERESVGFQWMAGILSLVQLYVVTMLSNEKSFPPEYVPSRVVSTSLWTIQASLTLAMLLWSVVSRAVKPEIFVFSRRTGWMYECRTSIMDSVVYSTRSICPLDAVSSSRKAKSLSTQCNVDSSKSMLCKLELMLTGVSIPGEVLDVQGAIGVPLAITR